MKHRVQCNFYFRLSHYTFDERIYLKLINGVKKVDGGGVDLDAL